MKVVKKGLMAMKVTELKEELEARSESVSGNKAWLRRRLHAAILCKQLRRERRARVQRAGVGRVGEGAGGVRSGRQRREERLGLVNERCRFFTVLRHPRRLLPL